MRRRSLFPWITGGIFFAVVTCLIVFVYIPIFANEDVVIPTEVVMYSYKENKKEYILENDKLKLTMDASTTQFSVLNKESGHVWYSNPPGADKDPIAVASEKEKMQSVFLLTYTPNSGYATTYNSYTHSVQNGIYEIVEEGDGLTVNYTVGKVSKIIYVPDAISKARMDQYTAGMSKKEVNTAIGIYRLYDPAKLKDSEREELLPVYPDLNEEPVYIMMPKQKDLAKSKAADMLAAVGYTVEDYEYDMSRIVREDEGNANVYNLSLHYRLSGSDLIVEAPYDEIRYPAAYPVTELILLPYFGAADTNEKGYMLVPEGGGGIINYNNGKILQTAYSANVYGWDYAQARNMLLAEPRTAYPVYGATGSGDSYLCMLEDGASYASIKANISGRTNSYNYAYAAYTIVHRDQYQVSTKTTEMIYMPEGSLPEGEKLTMRYRFIASDSYVDMAGVYGEYLADSGLIGEAAQEDAPIVIDLIGAIDKMEKQLGVPARKAVALTDFASAVQIVRDLNRAGLAGLSVRYNGWANNGLNQQVFSSVTAEGALGGEKKLKEFISAAQLDGNIVYLDGMSEFAYDSGLFKGFNVYRDAAEYTTKDRVVLRHFSPIYFAPILSNDAYYLVTPAYMLKMACNFSDGVLKYGANGISYRDMGYLLSADYNANDRVSREASLKIQREAMEYARVNNQRIMLRFGNLYALSDADVITDMDFKGSNYTIMDSQVPFFQIAVHGRMNYTGESLNMSGDMETALLRSAEYGAGLGFTFIYEDADILVDTDYTAYVSSAWKRWKDSAVEIMTRYRKDMQGLNKLRIVDHCLLSDTLTVTRYEDGTSVYVNYSSESAEGEGVTIPARSYLVKGMSSDD